jgi:uncharacterized membrane protein YagU involved in acid resistance
VKGKRQNVFKGLAAGLVAGGLASFAMDTYWWVMQKSMGARPEQKPRPGDDVKENEPATQVMADRVARALTGKEVPNEMKPAAGVGAHYAAGILSGALFGAAAALRPRLGVLGGIFYGVAIWLLVDEIGIRALDMAPNPSKVPTHEHVQALGAHMVYGSATALFTRLLLRIGSR